MQKAGNFKQNTTLLDDLSSRTALGAVWVTLHHDGYGGEKTPLGRRADKMCPQKLKCPQDLSPWDVKLDFKYLSVK